MSDTKLICWNINGLRAAFKHGFLEWLYKESPDILCLQESKVTPEDLPVELRNPTGYFTYWNNPVKKGYAGVSTFCQKPPLNVLIPQNCGSLDTEGRIIITEHDAFTLYNVYFPNGKKDANRLKYKLLFYQKILVDLETRRSKGEKLIICGDYNTAHQEIDLARPKENAKISGFLPEERAWLDTFILRGYIDVYRHFHKETGRYTYWDIKTGARSRNVGWRIDYFFISANLLPQVTEATILQDVMGSDHCPITLVLKTQ